MTKTPQIPAMPGMTPLGFAPARTGDHSIGLGVANRLSDDQAELARRKAAAPLRPRKEQIACDHGLFGDDARQIDLVDLTRGAK
jgi:hypothetical protein